MDAGAGAVGERSLDLALRADFPLTARPPTFAPHDRFDHHEEHEVTKSFVHLCVLRGSKLTALAHSSQAQPQRLKLFDVCW
jgi:hypothetical protein